MPRAAFATLLLHSLRSSWHLFSTSSLLTTTMDFAKLDRLVNQIGSQRGWTNEMVLDEWLGKRSKTDHDDPESWREDEGIPCIKGGLTALCGKSDNLSKCGMTDGSTGTLNGRGGTFPWKTLPTLLAHRGCVIHNYPENVLVPGERRTTLLRSKGIHDLTLPSRAILADALKNNSLTVQHITAGNTCRRLLASREPIILGEAPAPESPHTHGRRVFVDGRIDRKGLPRQLPSPEPSPAPSAPSRHSRRQVFHSPEPSPEPEPSPGPSTPPRLHRRRPRFQVNSPEASPELSPSPRYPNASRRRNVRMFVEVPLAPPSWKLKAAQRRSSSAPATPPLVPTIPLAEGTSSAPVDTPPSAQRADAGELIPQISYLSQPFSSQRSAITDVTYEDELEGSS